MCSEIVSLLHSAPEKDYMNQSYGAGNAEVCPLDKMVSIRPSELRSRLFCCFVVLGVGFFGGGVCFGFFLGRGGDL